MRGMSGLVNSNCTRGCTVRIITLDFETYWDSKEYTLSKIGPISYIRDERFYAQLLSVRINREAVQVYEHSDIPHVVANLGLERPDTVTVGHNVSGFDALILSEIYGIRPRNIWDTIPMARWCGIARLTRENHKCLTAWLGHGVKQDGTVVSDGKRTREDFSPEEWAFFKQYCADDTLQCSENFFSMLPYMTSDALKFMSITARMATEPAFTLSRPELAAYIIELEAKEEQARKEISSLYHFDTPEEMLKAIRSANTFVSMLEAFGCKVPMKVSEKRTETKRNELLAARDKALEAGKSIADIQAQLDDPTKYTVMVPALSKTDLEFLDLLDHPDPRVSQLAALRLEHNSSGQMSRARRFYELSQTGKPLPFMLKTFFAHTGRYGAGNNEGASDSINMQNISKRNPEMLALRKAIHVPDGYKVVAADSSQIEARMVAYLANEVELLDQFRQGRDPYAELAEKIFGATAQEIHDGAKSGDKRMKMYRNVGKTAILSCFAGDTEVFTHRGWIAIEDLSVSDYLLGMDYEYHKPKGIVCNGTKRCISLDGVLVTPDHKIYDEYKGCWVEAGQYTDINDLYDLVTAIPKKFMNANMDIYRVTMGKDEVRHRWRVSYPMRTEETYECEVYDILECGPTHSFLVRTDHGAIWSHNCGYNVGWKKFSDTLLRQGVKLNANLDEHAEMAKHAHSVYRMSNASIVTLWDRCQRVIEALAIGSSGFFAGPHNDTIEYGLMPVPGASDLVPSIKLPNGYILRYPNLHAEIIEGSKRPQYFYDRPKGKNVIKTKIYGGSTTENICQSLAFQLLMWQACRMVERGIHLHGNIHDSFAAIVPDSEVEHTVQVMTECMSSVPDWLQGFPVACEAEVGIDFTVV